MPHLRMRSRSRPSSASRRSRRRRTRARVSRSAQEPASVAQQRRGVELTLAHERLRVDGEPGLALGAQDVAAVEVLVKDHCRTLVAAQIDAGRYGFVEDLAFEGTAERFPVAWQLECPACGSGSKRRESVAGAWRPPQNGQHRRGDACRLVVVLDVPQARARLTAFDQKRTAWRVVLERDELHPVRPSARARRARARSPPRGS